MEAEKNFGSKVEDLSEQRELHARRNGAFIRLKYRRGIVKLKPARCPLP